ALKELLSLDESQATPEQNLRPALITFSVMVLFLATVVLMPNAILYTPGLYHRFHPYLSCVVVCMLIYLRNSTKALKARYLALPAALGTASLETYLLHNHIWLAGDGTTRLHIWPASDDGSPTFFLSRIQPAVQTIVLLWLAGKCHGAA